MIAEEKRYSHIFAEEKAAVEPASPVTASSDEGGDIMSLIMNSPAPKPVFIAEENKDLGEEIEKPEPSGLNEGLRPSAIENPEPSGSISHKPTAQELQRTAKHSAEMWVSTITMATKQICSAISGQPSDVYTPEEGDRKEYVKVCTAYFAEVGEVMSPKTLFMISSMSFFGAMIAKSLGDRKRQANHKEAEKKYQAAKIKEAAALRVVEETGDTERLEEARKEIKEAKSTSALRNHFQIDSKGYYTHDVHNNYTKGHKGENPEKCTDERILSIIKEHRNGKDPAKKKWGYINKQVRLMLYGHEEPVKNDN